MRASERDEWMACEEKKVRKRAEITQQRNPVGGRNVVGCVCSLGALLRSLMNN